jgi:hypothetical protein
MVRARFIIIFGHKGNLSSLRKYLGSLAIDTYTFLVMAALKLSNTLSGNRRTMTLQEYLRKNSTIAGFLFPVAIWETKLLPKHYLK